MISDLVFEKIMIFLFFEGYFLVNFQKNRSQKPSMLEEKQGQLWNLHRIPNKTSNPDFCFWFFNLIFFFFFFGIKKSNCNFYSKIFPHKKIRRKSGFEVLCGIGCRFQNWPCFFLALIVFDFYSFEGSKTHFTGEANVYIYICIYCVLLEGFDTINAFNQRTIWFCIFQPSWFISYFFSINSIVFIWNFL